MLRPGHWRPQATAPLTGGELAQPFLPFPVPLAAPPPLRGCPAHCPEQERPPRSKRVQSSRGGSHLPSAVPWATKVPAQAILTALSPGPQPSNSLSGYGGGQTGLVRMVECDYEGAHYGYRI